MPQQRVASGPADGPILLPIPTFEASPRMRWLRGGGGRPPDEPARRGRGPFDEPGWYERWAVSAGGVVVPVEFYSGVEPPEHLSCLEARTIRTEAPGLPELLHLAIRFGAGRPVAG